MEQNDTQQVPPDDLGASENEKTKQALMRSHATKYAATGIGVLLVVAGAVAIFRDSGQLGSFELGAEFRALPEQVGSVDEAEETGFSYALGAPSTDETDYDTYQLPAVDDDLVTELVEVFNSSEAFEGVEHINELLEYDDFDQNGNIKEEVMRDLIEIGKEAM